MSNEFLYVKLCVIRHSDFRGSRLWKRCSKYIISCGVQCELCHTANFSCEYAAVMRSNAL